MHFLFSLLLLLAPSGESTGKIRVSWLSPLKHDFGEIPTGKAVLADFRFRNDSPEAIRIDLVRTDCGCTAAKYTDTPIEPGETGVVSIQFDAAQSGPFRKKILVFFDGQRKGTVLRIRGTVL